MSLFETHKLENKKINHKICQLYQTNHGNMSLYQIIRILQRNQYHILQYLEQEIGIPGQHIINILLMRERRSKFHPIWYEYTRYGRIRVDVSFWNFNCRYQPSLCSHTQEIMQQMRKEVGQITAYELLIDVFTNGELPKDIIEIIMLFYCRKYFILPKFTLSSITSHYMHCLNYIISNSMTATAKFYDIIKRDESMPSLIDVSVDEGNDSQLSIADFIQTPQDIDESRYYYYYHPKKYNYFIKVTRKTR